MFDFSLRAISSFLIVSIAWWVGGIELYHILTNFSIEWYWLFFALLYSIVLNELFCQLIISHQYFPINTKSITYKILSFLQAVDHTTGSAAGFAQVHIVHHLHPDDKDKDPLYAKTNWLTTNTMSPLLYIYQSPIEIPDEKFFRARWKLNKDIINDEWTAFCYQYKTSLTLAYWLALYLVLPVILFKIVFLGRLLISIVMAICSIGTHKRLLIGMQNVKDKDSTYNNHLFNILVLGLFPSMLHNNHHNSYTTKTHSNHWYELDFGSMIIHYILRPLLIRRD